MGDPVIKGFADLMRQRAESQIGTREQQAQLFATIKEQRAKRMQEARDTAEDRALTVQQRQREAQQLAQEDAMRQQEAIQLVMPSPQVVRTDPRGVESTLATGAAGSINNLGQMGGASVQPAAQGMEAGQGLTPTLDTLNQQNPISGGRLGVNFNVAPNGTVVRTQRSQLDTGLRGLDALNSIIGAARGGRPLLTVKERVEDFDRTLQLEAARFAQARQLVEDEGKAAGLAFYNIAKGKGEGNVADVATDLTKRYGPAVGGQMVQEGIRQARMLDFEQRKSLALEEMKGEQTKVRAMELAREKEGLRAARPETALKNREAGILLKISEGKSLSKPEREFLDERQKLSLEGKILRNIGAKIGAGGAQPEPEAAKQTLTPEANNKLWAEFGSSLGRQPTNDDRSGYVDFLRGKGY